MNKDLLLRRRSLLNQSGYQKVEYLKSTGSEWIDTGVMPSGTDWVVETKFMYETFAPYAPIYSDYQGEDYNATRLILSGTDDTYAYVNNSNMAGNATRIRLNKLMIFTVADYYDYCLINGNRTNKTMLSRTTDSNNSLHLFSNPSHGQNNASIRIYYQKIYNDGVLVRDFVPCYRRSDKTPGMYDFVDNVFYANGGTGRFVVGQNLN